MSKLIDLTGQRFGRLTVVSRSDNSKSRKARWVCRCDCGNQTIVVGSDLRSKKTTSCGCVSKEMFLERITIHNGNKTRLYQIWLGIKARTTNKNHIAYSNYGERGIKLGSEWENDFNSFEMWALKNGYRDDLTIDRIDNKKGYSPDNCRWVSMKIQSNNKRNNHYIDYQGETKTISEWAELFGVRKDTLYMRLKNGWSIEKALTTPTKKE